MSLIARYKLEGNANDEGGTYNGTATNVTYTTGKQGQCGVFASGSGIDAGSNSALNPTPAMSLAAWINPSIGTGSGDKIIIARDDTGSNRAFVLYRQNSDAKISFVVWNSSGTLAQVVSAAAVSQSAWTHVAATVNEGGDGKLRVYINGSLSNTTSSTSTTSIKQCAISTKLGWDGSGSNGRSWVGSLDDVRIYNHALTASEVLSLYNSYSGSLLLRRRRAA